MTTPTIPNPRLPSLIGGNIISWSSLFVNTLLTWCNAVVQTVNQNVSNITTNTTNIATNTTNIATNTASISALQALPATVLSLALETSNQTVVANTPTLVHFNTVITDTQTAWSGSSYKYTPTVAGIYLFTFSLNLAQTSGGAAYIQINKNGSTIGFQSFPLSNGAANPVIQMVMPVPMNGSTDYVQFYGLSSSTTFYAGANATFVQGILL